MRILSIALIACMAIFTMAFAEEEAKTEETTATVKIIAAPSMKHVDAFTAATTFTKAADFAPEEGWGEKDQAAAFEAMAINGFEKLAAWMNDERKPVGPFFAVWYDDPSTTKPADFTSKQGFPISGEYDPTVAIVIEEMPETDVASVVYMGHYKDAMNAWNALMKFIADEGYTFAGAPMEIYLKSMDETDNPEEWVTEIQWPVVKAEAEETAPEVEKVKE